MNARQLLSAILTPSLLLGLLLTEGVSAGEPNPGLARKDGVGHPTWTTRSGLQLRVNPQECVQTAPDGRVSTVPRKSSTLTGDQGMFKEDCPLIIDPAGQKIVGHATLEVRPSDKADEDLLLCRSTLTFEKPLAADITVQWRFDVLGPGAERVSLPQRDGHLVERALKTGATETGRFRLGDGAAVGEGIDLGLPVLDLAWKPAGRANPARLAVAADPYCGCSISTTPLAIKKLGTQIVIATKYRGTLVPIEREEHTFVLESHRDGVDRSMQTFYRTIPDIKPGPAWTRDIHLVYYDYLAEKGEGWFKGLQFLADRIPAQHRGRVAVCLHGWYDYFQQYGYDHSQKKLMKEWMAFPGTYKVPMSLESMHRRIKFAKGLGFRTLLYYADGTNSDSGAPNFRKDYVLRDKDGKSFDGWKGPDSLGQPLKMDPAVPGLQDWYRGYLKALLDEYAKEVDGFVWDETFYIPNEFVSYPGGKAAYSDRAMMRLTADLTRLVQQYHPQNPDLVFLASDLGQTNYSLVAHGTYQDSACHPPAWGPSMWANYRNCLWSCNWMPVTGAKNNEIAAVQYGLPQGLSSGYGDDRGPHAMPPALLAQVLDRFIKNVEGKRQRAKTMEEVQVDAREKAK